jgi:hypothetical protein
MKIFKDDDGLFDIASKLTTTAGVCFGIWAYFHTIHPVFEKEIELQNLRGESKTLSVQVESLSSTLATLKQDKSSLGSSVELLRSEKETLINDIEDKEKQLQEIIASFKSASDAAVLNKLQYYSDKLVSAYLLAISTNKGSAFNVIDYSHKILATHVPAQDDKYGQQAYEYFKKYVHAHEGKQIKGDEVVEFSISLFFNYKIDLIKQRI